MFPTSIARAFGRLAMLSLLATLPSFPLAGGANDGHSHVPAASADSSHAAPASDHQTGYDHSAGPSVQSRAERASVHQSGHTHPAASSEHRHDSRHGPAQLDKGTELIRARQLFMHNCAKCHGDRGQGTSSAATDFSEPQALVRLTREIIAADLAGGHGNRLAAVLSDDDREAIIGYMRNYLMLPAPDADTDIGRAIYSRACSVCHGDRGDAASWAKNSLYPPPADFTAHGKMRLAREKMIETVTFGSKNSAMMAFAVQLSQQEIAATVDYIRTAFMPDGMGAGTAEGDHADARHTSHEHDHGQTAEASQDTPFPNQLVGDPVWGREFYQANCAECHGDKGDGQGRRAYFMSKKPEDFLSREARSELDRPKLFEHVSKGVIGTTMPAWETVLTPQEIANVAEYVYRAFLHPDRFAAVAPPAAPGWQKGGQEPVDSKKN